MKQLMITVCTAVFMLAFIESSAQEKKVKVKDDKVKTKDGDTKIKSEGGEVKIKDGDNKVKLENNEVKVKDEDGKLKAEGVTITDWPYKADYSSQFALGNPAHAKKILEIWKDYDDNAFQRHTDYYADSFLVVTSDGQSFKGRDSALRMVTQYRSGLTNVKSTVDAWMPVRSLDRNEDWVLVWGTETATDSQGKTSTVGIHEIWSFNKDGKVNFMRQYMGQIPKQ